MTPQAKEFRHRRTCTPPISGQGCLLAGDRPRTGPPRNCIRLARAVPDNHSLSAAFCAPDRPNTRLFPALPGDLGRTRQPCRARPQISSAAFRTFVIWPQPRVLSKPIEQYFRLDKIGGECRRRMGNWGPPVGDFGSGVDVAGRRRHQPDVLEHGQGPGPVEYRGLPTAALHPHQSARRRSRNAVPGVAS